jgi:hypothetical protein
LSCQTAIEFDGKKIWISLIEGTENEVATDTQQIKRCNWAITMEDIKNSGSCTSKKLLLLMVKNFATEDILLSKI